MFVRIVLGVIDVENNTGFELVQHIFRDVGAFQVLATCVAAHQTHKAVRSLQVLDSHGRQDNRTIDDREVLLGRGCSSLLLLLLLAWTAIASLLHIRRDFPFSQGIQKRLNIVEACKDLPVRT